MYTQLAKPRLRRVGQVLHQLVDAPTVHSLHGRRAEATRRQLCACECKIPAASRAQQGVSKRAFHCSNCMRACMHAHAHSSHEIMQTRELRTEAGGILLEQDARHPRDRQLPLAQRSKR